MGSPWCSHAHHGMRRRRRSFVVVAFVVRNVTDEASRFHLRSRARQSGRGAPDPTDGMGRSVCSSSLLRPHCLYNKLFCTSREQREQFQT